MESLAQPIQMQLSKKLKTFSRIVATFLKLASNFERFGKKDDLHSNRKNLQREIFEMQKN